MIRYSHLSITGVVAVLLVTVAAQPPSTGSGQAFPDKPIRMIVPLPPGSASDFLARTLGLSLSIIHKQQVVVDNHPGAGGLIGSTLLTKSTPDGYTLAMIAPPHVVGPLLQASPPYRPLEDIVAVAGIATIPNMLVIAPNVPAAMPMLHNGRLRALAVTGAKRTPAFPEVPTVTEAGLPAAESDGWWGVIAPAGTPRRLATTLNSDLVALLRQADTKEKYARQGATVIDDPSPEGFMTLMKSEYSRYQQLIKDIGVKPQ